jgi:hypothetical protein
MRVTKLYRIVELPSDEEVDYIGYPATPKGITDGVSVGFVEVDTKVLPLSEELIDHLDYLDVPRA